MTATADIKGVWDALDGLIAKKHQLTGTAPAPEITAIANKRMEQNKLNLEKALLMDVPDPRDRSVNTAQSKEYVMGVITKDLKSTDLNSLRLVSLADKMGELRNGQTVFLNVVEANSVQRVTDFQVRLRERRLGQQTAQWLSLNQDQFAPEAQSNYPQRSNTLGFLGNQLNIRLIGQELAAQSPVQPVDIVQQEIEFEVTRIRRAMSKYLLFNYEVVNEASITPPQPGGFINRSNLYNFNLSVPSDFTNAIIQQSVDAIANAANPEGVSYNVPLVCLCPSSQISKIRDLMIARYPGTNAETFLNEQSELRARFAQVGIAPNQMKAYQPDPGMSVLFIFDPLLPGNTAIFFDPTQPQLGKFQINGQYGPWAIERPTPALTTLLYVFDGFTLLDNLRETRSVVTNLNN
jgi:hypothetical protein